MDRKDSPTSAETEIIKVLVQHTVLPPRASQLTVSVKELQQKYPKLSDEEIERIADEVAARFMKQWASEAKLKERERDTIGKHVRRIVEEILIGLASSAIYSLLLYLLNVRLSAASASADIESIESNARRAQVLTDPLSPETRQNLDEHTPDLFFFGKSVWSDIASRARSDNEIRDLLHKVTRHRRDEEKPAIESMFYDTFARFVQSGLTKEGYKKLEHQPL